MKTVKYLTCLVSRVFGAVSIIHAHLATTASSTRTDHSSTSVPLLSENPEYKGLQEQVGRKVDLWYLYRQYTFKSCSCSTLINNFLG